jgi:hypothetical protein
MVSEESNKALVIGNGESRKHINIELYRNTHTLIGCNALHRDTVVDHLICCDRRMAEESTNNPNTSNTQIYVRPSWFHYFRKIQKNKNVNLLPELPYVGETKKDQPDHWGSGGYAMLLAASLGFKEIEIVGFDLYPKGDTVNNIYKGTVNYSKEDAKAVDYSYWVYQIAQIFKYYPDTTFIIRNNQHWFLPEDWQKSNVRFVAL